MKKSLMKKLLAPILAGWLLWIPPAIKPWPHSRLEVFQKTHRNPVVENLLVDPNGRWYPAAYGRTFKTRAECEAFRNEIRRQAMRMAMIGLQTPVDENDLLNALGIRDAFAYGECRESKAE
jgi:hypothetical protein